MIKSYKFPTRIIRSSPEITPGDGGVSSQERSSVQLVVEEAASPVSRYHGESKIGLCCANYTPTCRTGHTPGVDADTVRMKTVGRIHKKPTGLERGTL
jgi:hypothetical protein